MLELKAYEYQLPLRHTFTISRGSLDVQPTMIVELRDAKGNCGYGEATTNDYYGFTLESMGATLRGARDAIHQHPQDATDPHWETMRHN